MRLYNFKIQSISLNESGKRPFIEYPHEIFYDKAILVNPDVEISDNYDGILCLSATPNSDNNTIFFGIRNCNSTIIKKKYYTMKEIYSEGLEESCSNVMAASREFHNLLLRINLDVLDPVFYPSEYVGGMTTRELIYVVQRIRMMNNLNSIIIIGTDNKIIEKLIVELS